MTGKLIILVLAASMSPAMGRRLSYLNIANANPKTSVLQSDQRINMSKMSNTTLSANLNPKGVKQAASKAMNSVKRFIDEGWMAKSSKAIAELMVIRSCINDFAHKYEKISREYNFESTRTGAFFRFSLGPVTLPPILSHDLKGVNASAPGMDTYPDGFLVNAMEDRWSLETKLANMVSVNSHLWTVAGGLTKEEQDLIKEIDAELVKQKDFIKSFGFSVTQATQQCSAMQSETPLSAVRNCALEMARSPPKAPKKMTQQQMKTMKQWNTESEQDNQQVLELVNAQDLVTLTSKYFERKDRQGTLKKVLNFQYKSRTDVAAAIRKEEAEKRRLKDIILFAFGFKMAEWQKSCRDKHRYQSGEGAQAFLRRTLMETKDVTYKNKDGKCEVIEGKMCPEGMNAALLAKGLDVKTGTEKYLQAVPVVAAANFGIAAVAGALINPAVGAAIAFPPFEWILPLPIAMWYSVDILPKCKCSPKSCEYNEETDSCELKDVVGFYSEISPSHNPYDWLPYPGQKCVGHKEKGKTHCRLNPCERSDFAPETTVDGVHGVVGKRVDAGMTGVYNCLNKQTPSGPFPLVYLSANETVHILHGDESESQKQTLVSNALSEVGYTTALRAELYDKVLPVQAFLPVQAHGEKV